jgi:hypothetical protein
MIRDFGDVRKGGTCDLLTFKKIFFDSSASQFLLPATTDLFMVDMQSGRFGEKMAPIGAVDI